jgi:hypothetical protein
MAEDARDFRGWRTLRQHERPSNFGLADLLPKVTSQIISDSARLLSAERLLLEPMPYKYVKR